MLASFLSCIQILQPFRIVRYPRLVGGGSHPEDNQHPISVRSSGLSSPWSGEALQINETRF